VPAGIGRRLVIAFEWLQQLRVPSSSDVTRTPTSAQSTDYSRLAIGCDHEAPFPVAYVLLLEYFRDAHDEALTIRRMKPNEQDATVRSRSESAHVGKIQILGDQESLILLRGIPDFAVALATQVLFGNGVNIVAEIRQDRGEMRRKIFVELDPHRMCGVAGTGRSSSAEAAAKAIAASTSSVFRAGKPARISSMESPAAKLANTVRSVTRVPRKTGSPPQIFVSLRILCWWFIGEIPFRARGALR